MAREAERAEIGSRLDRAALRDGSMLCVVGAPGSGRTSLLDDAVLESRRRGFEVIRASPGDCLDTVLSARRVVVIDDVESADESAVAWLRGLESRVVDTEVLALVTLTRSVGMRSELQLIPLSSCEMSAVFPTLGHEETAAIHLASGGLPGAAHRLARVLDEASPGSDPVVTLALAAASSTSFLVVDPTQIRLLETALAHAPPPGDRARLLARLGRELLADSTAGGRRRSLLDEALLTARESADPLVVAEVLDARIYALWDPHAAHDRLSGAEEIVRLARHSSDARLERDGVFWRFVALIELGQVEEAEVALAAYSALARAAGDVSGQAMATAREAMLAVLRGRFKEAERLIAIAGDLARRAGRADAADIVGTLLGSVRVARRDHAQLAPAIRAVTEAARLRPGHFHEATLAMLLAEDDQPEAARAELERVLPQLLAGTGPRWLGAVSDLAIVCARTGESRRACALYSALLPYAGRLVVLGAANSARGPVDQFLGLLARQTGDVAAAVTHFEAAAALQERVGALPGLAESLSALADVLDTRRSPGDAAEATMHRDRAQSIIQFLGINPHHSKAAGAAGWSLSRDGSDWLLDAGSERARLRDSRGLHHLRMLIAAPGQDISPLDLAAGGQGLVATAPTAVLDSRALREFRRRIQVLDEDLDAADRSGDTAAARHVWAERDELQDEVRRGAGLGGRPRALPAEAERARVNTTRTLRAAIAQISAAAPLAAAHLAASIHTGNACRYEPGAGGPSHWQV